MRADIKLTCICGSSEWEDNGKVLECVGCGFTADRDRMESACTRWICREFGDGPQARPGLFETAEQMEAISKYLAEAFKAGFEAGQKGEEDLTYLRSTVERMKLEKERLRRWKETKR